MFSAEVLQRIYCDKDLEGIPVCYQSTVIRVVERALKEDNHVSESIYVSKSVSNESAKERLEW